MSEYRYKRVLLKLSGEALMGEGRYGIDPEVTERLALQVKGLHADGVEVGIVVGGGNIFRGLAGSAKGMDRAQADYMGMLATVMNALALQDAFERTGVPCRVMSAIQMNEVCEPLRLVGLSSSGLSQDSRSVEPSSRLAYLRIDASDEASYEAYSLCIPDLA